MPNNLDYVAFLERIYRRGDCYILGGFGNTLTPTFIDAKCRQYLYNMQNKATLIANMGKVAHDCYGMLKSFLWGNEDGGGRYNAAQDRNETMALNAATEKGDLASIQKMLGVAVWKTDHVGFVVDCTPADYRNWIVIECYSIPRGILRRTLAEGGWMKWFKDTFLEYKNPPVQEVTTMGTFPQPITYRYSDPSDPTPLECHTTPDAASPVNGQSFANGEAFDVTAIQDAGGHAMAKTARGWASLGTAGKYWAAPVIPSDNAAEVQMLAGTVQEREAQVQMLAGVVQEREGQIKLQDGQLVDERNEVNRLREIILDGPRKMDP